MLNINLIVDYKLESVCVYKTINIVCQSQTGVLYARVCYNHMMRRRLFKNQQNIK